MNIWSPFSSTKGRYRSYLGWNLTIKVPPKVAPGANFAVTIWCQDKSKVIENEFDCHLKVQQTVSLGDTFGRNGL